MADWPPELPDLQLLGLKGARQDALLRSPMDAGSPKVRRKFTHAVDRYQIPVIFNGAEKNLFDEFYRFTLVEGSIPFIWEDPLTDAPIDLQFTEPPTFRMELGGTPGARIWTATLALETLPRGVAPTLPPSGHIFLTASLASASAVGLTILRRRRRFSAATAAQSLVQASLDLGGAATFSAALTSASTIAAVTVRRRRRFSAALSAVSAITAVTVNRRRRFSATVTSASTTAAALTILGPAGPGATPAFASVGVTTSSATLAATHTIAHPATVNAGDLLLCLALGRNTSDAALAMHASMTAAGWQHLTGSPFQPTTARCLLVAWKIAAGTEGGTNIPGGIVGTGPAGTSPAFIGHCQRWTAADGFAVNPLESITSALESNNVTTNAPTVTPTDENRCGVAVFGGNGAATSFSYTGETGGNWTVASHITHATGAVINTQSVDLPAGTPITGGSATMSVAAGGPLVGFALVPADVGGGGNGGNGGAFVVGTFYPEYGSGTVPHTAVPWADLDQLYYFGCTWRTEYQSSLDLATDFFTADGHPFTNGQAVQLANINGSATPAHSGGSLAYDTNYFVRDVAGSTFKLALTAGGAALNFTTNAATSFGRRFKAPTAYLNRYEFTPPITPAAVTSIFAQRDAQNPDCKVWLCIGRNASIGGLKTSMDYGGAVGSRAGLPGLIASIRTVFNEGPFDGIISDIETMQVTGTDGLGADGTFIYDLHEALRTEFGPSVPIDCFITRVGGSSTKDILAFNMITDGLIDAIQLNGYALHFHNTGSPETVVWHHGALNGTSDFGAPSGNAAVYQIETVAKYVTRGVPIGKIKLGLQAGGVPWPGGIMTAPAGSVGHGARFPLDNWGGGTIPDQASALEVTYREFLAGALAHTGSDVDEAAVAFFAWKTNASPALELFWSSENPATAATKRTYWEAQGLGGLFLWQLAGDDATFSITAAMGPPAGG